MFENCFFFNRSPDLWVFIVALALQYSVSTECSEFESQNSPLLFKGRGQLEISGRSYHCILEVSVAGLLDTIAPIGENIEQIASGLENALSKLDYNAPRRSEFDRRNVTQFNAISDALDVHMRSHMRFLLADIKDKHDQLLTFMKTLGQDSDPMPIRQKRGLIDGGGRILSWLLGVATEDEVVDTRDLIARVTELAETTRMEVNLHSEILNTTALSFERVDDHLDKLSACLGQVRANVLGLTQMIESDAAHTYSMVHAIIMTNSLSYSSSAISDLSDQFLNLKIGLTRFRSGYLSPEIVPPGTILKLVDVIANQNLRPIYPATDEYLPLLYKYIRVDPVPLRPLSFIISIPLMGDPKIQLELYEIFNMAHPVSPTLTMSYSNIPRFLAVSDDRRMYQEFADMDSCRRHGSYYLCNTDLPVYRDDAQSCALDLFRGISDVNCNKHFSGPLKKTILVKSDLGWLYSFSKEVKISITCPTNTTRISIPRGSGRIHTASQCKISAKDFILPSEARPTGNALSFNASLVAPFSVSLSEGELEKIALMNDSEILTNIMSLNDDKLPLKSLKSEVKNLAYIKKMRQINSVTSTAGIALSSLAFIGVILLIIVLFCFCRVATDVKHSDKMAQLIQAAQGKESTVTHVANQRPISNDNIELPLDPIETIQIPQPEPAERRRQFYNTPSNPLLADRHTSVISQKSEHLELIQDTGF